MIPPRNFKSVEGVASARISPVAPGFLKERKRSSAAARGVRYEKKAQAYLLSQFRDFYIPSPWLHFRELSAETFRWCQPDGILLDIARGVCCIVEVKYSHTVDAWWQTRKLYTPVLAKIFPETYWRFEVCEVVRWYNPDVLFPEEVRLVNNPLKECAEFKVHIFNP